MVSSGWVGLEQIFSGPELASSPRLRSHELAVLFTVGCGKLRISYVQSGIGFINPPPPPHHV
jgi:hypothetical protein